MPTTLSQLQHNIQQTVYSQTEKPVPGIPSDMQARLVIHQRNTVQSLRDVLKETYPVLYQLVGEDFFRQLATDFIHAQPPESGCLLFYGGGMSAFLTDYTPVASLPYLADMAVLEWAYNEAYNAPDAAPIDPVNLQAIEPESYDQLIFETHPAMRYLTSSFAVFDIWQAHQITDEKARDEALANIPDLYLERPDYVLITRPAYHVINQRIAPEIYMFIQQITAGKRLGKAFEDVLTQYPEIDPQQIFIKSLQEQLFKGFAIK